MEITLLKKIIQYRIQWEMKKMDIHSRPHKTMINVTKEPCDTHKTTLKEEILEEISEKFTGKILCMVNQNVQKAPKKFQDTKNKEQEKMLKQINEH
jgi:hypothetical protein